MRKQKLLGGLAVAAVLVVAGTFVAWPRQSRVTEENFNRIKEGMSRAEVYVILGPPGDYSTGPVECSAQQEYFRGYDFATDKGINYEEGNLSRWWSDTGSAAPPLGTKRGWPPAARSR